MPLAQFTTGAERREQQDSQRFIDAENTARLATAEQIKAEAEARTLEYQRDMARLTKRLGDETGVTVSDHHETIDGYLRDLMSDTFGWAVRELEDQA